MPAHALWTCYKGSGAGVAALGVRLHTWGELATAMKSWGRQVGTLRPQGRHRAFPEQPPYFCGSRNQG